MNKFKLIEGFWPKNSKELLPVNLNFLRSIDDDDIDEIHPVSKSYFHRTTHFHVGEFYKSISIIS